MIEKIKKDIVSKVGRNYIFKINNIRNRIECVEGSIVEVYDRVFIVNTNSDLVLSFNYSDVLTGNVEIQDKMCWLFYNNKLKFK